MNEWAVFFLGVMAVTAVLQCAFVIAAALGLRKTGERVNELCRRFDGEIKPTLEDLRKGAANLRAISDSGRAAGGADRGSALHHAREHRDHHRDGPRAGGEADRLPHRALRLLGRPAPRGRHLQERRAQEAFVLAAEAAVRRLGRAHVHRLTGRFIRRSEALDSDMPRTRRVDDFVQLLRGFTPETLTSAAVSRTLPGHRVRRFVPGPVRALERCALHSESHLSRRSVRDHGGLLAEGPEDRPAHSQRAARLDGGESRNRRGHELQVAGLQRRRRARTSAGSTASPAPAR